MSRSHTRGVLSLVLIVAVVGMLVPATLSTTAQSNYEISVPNAIEVPDRDVTVDGDQFTITRVSQVEQPNDIQVHVDAPADETYDVNLYNYKSQDVDRRTTTGTSDVTFPTDDLRAGPYYVAVIQSDYRDVYPVVVKGYDVDIDAPSSVEHGETADVTLPVESTASSGSLHEVQVVVGDELRRIDATESGGTYTASISTDDLGPGEYPIYGVVRGEAETEDGRKIILGLSSRQTLTVTGSTATESGDSGSSGSTGGDGGGGGSTSDTTPTATPATTPSTEPTGTADESGFESPTASPTEASPETTRSPTDTPNSAPSPTDDGVITPASPAQTETTPSSSPTPTGGQPGFGVVVTVLAAAALIVARRRP